MHPENHHNINMSIDSSAIQYVSAFLLHLHNHPNVEAITPLDTSDDTLCGYRAPSGYCSLGKAPHSTSYRYRLSGGYSAPGCYCLPGGATHPTRCHMGTARQADTARLVGTTRQEGRHTQQAIGTAHWAGTSRWVGTPRRVG